MITKVSMVEGNKKLKEIDWWCITISGAESINLFLDLYKGKHLIQKLSEKAENGLNYSLLPRRENDIMRGFDYGEIKIIEDGSTGGEYNPPQIVVRVKRDFLGFLINGCFVFSDENIMRYRDEKTHKRHKDFLRRVAKEELGIKEEE